MLVRCGGHMKAVHACTKRLWMHACQVCSYVCTHLNSSFISFWSLDMAQNDLIPTRARSLTFDCATAVCTSMHNKISINLLATCTIKMLVKNYLTDVQACLYKIILQPSKRACTKKLIMHASQACSYVYPCLEGIRQNAKYMLNIGKIMGTCGRHIMYKYGM